MNTRLSWHNLWTGHKYGKVKEPVKGLQRGKLRKYDVSRLIISRNRFRALLTPAALISVRAHEPLLQHREDSGNVGLAEENGINTTLARRARDNGAIGKVPARRGIGRPDEERESGRDRPDSGRHPEDRTGGRHRGSPAGYCGRVRRSQTGSRFLHVDSEPGEVLLGRAGREIAGLMAGIKKPWIGSKVLGAGRDTPPDGFRHAFEKGADFVAAGMFDWQAEDDAAHVRELLAKGVGRDRAWA
jgi:hypothetical protein